MRWWYLLLLAVAARSSSHVLGKLASSQHRRRRTHAVQRLSVSLPRMVATAAARRRRPCRLAVHVLPLDAHACAHELGQLLPDMVRDSGAILGLDCEWQPETKSHHHSRIAVIQISSGTHCCILQPLHTTAPAAATLGSSQPAGSGLSAGAPVCAEAPAHAPAALAQQPGAAAEAAAPGAARTAPEPTGGAQAQPPPAVLVEASSCPAAAASGAVGCAAPHLVGAEAGAGPALPAACALPDELRRMLEDPAIVKAGVGIFEDIRRLRRDFGVQVQGALDVRLALQRLAPHHLAGGGSLQALSLSLLGVLTDKSQQVSDWHHRDLTKAQLVYAAHDAFLSREMAVHLALGSCTEAATGSCTPGASDARPAAAPAAALHAALQPLLDINPHRDRAPRARDKQGAKGPPGSSGLPLRPAPGPPPPNSVPRKESIPTRKTELYENCRLLAPDGGVLCTCGRKKVRWYVERGLAVVLTEEPLTAQLKFEPRGRGHADDKYYLSDKVNRCCVCGREGDYLRHNVVPHCYRSLFPESHKSHLSHDVVLLCQACHKVCCSADHVRMRALGQLHGAPLDRDNQKFIPDSGDSAVRSAVRALTSKALLPEGRRAELEAAVLEHFGAAELTPELLNLAGQLEAKKPNMDWRSHASIVVGGLSPPDIDAFVRGWRQHFLHVMKPAFLPPYWSIDARVANSSASSAAPAECAGSAGATA